MGRSNKLITMTQINTQTLASDSDDLIVKCAQLTKTFRDFWLRNRVTAVDGVDLHVGRGEVFGLLGPNGSGKSTTIKLLLGLLHPTSGRIAVFGRHPREVSIKKRIGYLPEESYLYRFLNARETLDYYGRLFHQDRRRRQRRINQLLEYVGLDKVARRPVGEYSKGMQRRIGIAQALINDPDLLILDEPTTGMDPIGTRQIKDLILDLRCRGKTILLCSHLLADVEDITDRVAIMFGGRIRKAGAIDDLLTRRDVTTVSVPLLNAEEINALDQVLEKCGKQIDRVDHPRQKLEDLFLEIVHEAQREGLATSGATSGGRAVDFLSGQQRGAHLPEDTNPHQLLDELTQDKFVPVASEPSLPDPMSKSELLEDLVNAEHEKKQPKPSEQVPATPKKDDHVDRDLLNDLTE